MYRDLHVGVPMAYIQEMVGALDTKICKNPSGDDLEFQFVIAGPFLALDMFDTD